MTLGFWDWIALVAGSAFVIGILAGFWLASIEGSISEFPLDGGDL